MSILNVNKINPVGGGSTITIAGIASVTNNISVGNSVTASAFYGDGQNITGSTIRPNFTFDGTDVQVPDKILLNTAGSSIKSNQLRFQAGAAYIDNYSNGGDINFRTSVSSALDTTGPIIKSTGNIAFASGKGIDFSAQTASSLSGVSVSSELLDHYEEGTFTPTFGASNGSSTAGYSTQSGKYTRIGNVVHFQFKLQVSNITGNRNQGLSIAGFPHTVDSSQPQCSGNFYAETWDGEMPTTIFYNGNTTRGQLYYYADAMKYYSTSMLDMNVNSSYLVGSGFYFAA